jgi:tripartite-type tricarboxylate transporter receptor subunit TctC
LFVLAGTALAQTWPDRPVRVVNPFAAGAASDVVGRLIAERLAQRFGKPFIVDNRPGANAMIGTEIVAKSAPDGYTLLNGGNTTHAANPVLYKSVPYDPVRDFEPVAYVVGLQYYLVVAPASPARTVADFIQFAKANTGKLSYGTGNATSTIAAELFKLATGTDFVQVPYKGNPLAVADLIGGSLTMMFLDNSTARPLLQGNRLRAIGTASARRSEQFPEVPTMAEAGFPGINLQAWIAMWFPAKTPRSIVERVNAEVNAARAQPEINQKLRELGFTLEGPGASPTEFGAFVKNEIALWGRVVRDAKIPQL